MLKQLCNVYSNLSAAAAACCDDDDISGRKHPLKRRPQNKQSSNPVYLGKIKGRNRGQRAVNSDCTCKCFKLRFFFQAAAMYNMFNFGFLGSLHGVSRPSAARAAGEIHRRHEGGSHRRGKLPNFGGNVLFAFKTAFQFQAFIGTGLNLVLSFSPIAGFDPRFRQMDFEKEPGRVSGEANFTEIHTRIAAAACHNSRYFSVIGANELLPLRCSPIRTAPLGVPWLNPIYHTFFLAFSFVLPSSFPPTSSPIFPCCLRNRWD